MIILDILPLSSIEGEGFIILTKCLIDFELYSRITYTNMLSNMYEKVKYMIQNQIFVT
jgi:hypothetical protein